MATYRLPIAKIMHDAHLDFKKLKKAELKNNEIFIEVENDV